MNLFGLLLTRKIIPNIHFYGKLNFLGTFSEFSSEIYCYGYRYQTSAQVVIYSQPTPEHFFWPDPINLDLESYKKTNENAQTKNLLNLNSSDQFTELEEALQQVIF